MCRRVGGVVPPRRVSLVSLFVYSSLASCAASWAAWRAGGCRCCLPAQVSLASHFVYSSLSSLSRTLASACHARAALSCTGLCPLIKYELLPSQVPRIAPLRRVASRNGDQISAALEGRPPPPLSRLLPRRPDGGAECWPALGCRLRLPSLEASRPPSRRRACKVVGSRLVCRLVSGVSGGRPRISCRSARVCLVSLLEPRLVCRLVSGMSRDIHACCVRGFRILSTCWLLFSRIGLKKDSEGSRKLIWFQAHRSPPL